MAAAQRDQLIRLLEPVVEGMGYELVELELVGVGGSRTLRLFIDSPTGISLDDCEAVSEAIGEVLDEDDPIPDAYNLEVSSPGVDRPLRKEADYDRFAGERVKVRTFAPIEGQRNFTGTLAGLDQDSVVLDTPEGRVEIPRSQVAKAHLVADI